MVLAFEVATGVQRWNFSTGGQVRSSPNIAPDNGDVLFGSFDGSVYRLNSSDGSLRWTISAGAATYVMSSPAISPFDGAVFFGAGTGAVYALSADGAVRWNVTVSAFIRSSPAISADGTRVFVHSGGDGAVYALEAATGETMWRFQAGGPTYGANFDSSPAIAADGTVYVGSFDGQNGGALVFALDGATGAMRWNFSTGLMVEASPTIGADGTVYIGGDDFRLYALDGVTGKLLWDYRTGDYINSGVAIGCDGTIFVGSNDHNLYAFH